MRGIIDCITWLTNNEGKELEITKDHSGSGSRVDKKIKLCSYRNNNDNAIKGVKWIHHNHNVCFSVLEECDFEPFVELVDFTTAYLNVSNDKSKVYTNNNNVLKIGDNNKIVMFRKEGRNVNVTSERGIVLNDMWSLEQ